MVPERDHVGARGEDLVRELRRKADSVGRVFRVDDAEGRAELVAQRTQTRLECPAARRAEDVCDEEDDQLRTSA